MTDKKLRTWAREADFPATVTWQQVEARVDAVETPSREELKETFPRDLVAGSAVVLGLIFLVPLSLVTFGMSWIGLGIVVAHAQEIDLPEWTQPLAQLAFYGAIVITFIPMAFWATSPGRRRRISQLLLSGGTALVSAVSFVVLLTVPSTAPWTSYRVLSAIAVVTGLGVFAFLMTAAKPGVRLRVSERLAIPSLEDRWRRVRRLDVLEVFVKRGLVSEADVSELAALPKGAWRDLESRPDGTVARRRS